MTRSKSAKMIGHLGSRFLSFFFFGGGGGGSSLSVFLLYLGEGLLGWVGFSFFRV